MASTLDEARFVNVRGMEQWIAIRGSDRSNPVLLIVGGPGVALSRMTPYFAPWERAFTIAHWDQPGAGGTYAKNHDGESEALSVERLTADGIAVADIVREHVCVNTVILLAISGGTIVGLEMIAERPDLFGAYVGTGQFVDWARQEARSYAMVLERARTADDRAAIAELERIGPPPYRDLASDVIRGKYAGALTAAEQAAFAALTPEVLAALRKPPPDASYVPAGLPDIDPREVSRAAYAQLREEYSTFDARRIATAFAVPMFFVQGDLDAYSTTPEVEEYAAAIDAPTKAVTIIEGGGHSCVFMRDAFLAVLNTRVSTER